MKYTNEPTRKPAPPGVIYAVIKAGFLAGSLDIFIVLIQYYLKTGKNVLVVLKYIAIAVYCKEAYLQ